MLNVKTFSRKKIVIFTVAIALFSFALSIRLAYIMIFQSEYYGKKADDLHERERYVKAARGEITDRDYRNKLYDYVKKYTGMVEQRDISTSLMHNLEIVKKINEREKKS